MKKPATGFFESRANIFLLLFIPTVALYAKSLAFGFTPLDEKWLIVDNAEYLKLWRSLPDAFTTSLYRLYYRPLLAVSIFIDYKIAGLSTYMYHVTNLAWHLVTIFCLFRLLTLFDVTRRTAAFLSLLFALHPAMLHAVAWVPGRNDLMLGAFTLAALIYLKKYLASADSKFLVVNLLWFTCALFTKESAVSLPALFFIVAYGQLPSKKIFIATGAWMVLTGGWVLLRQLFVSSLPGSPLPFGSRLANFFTGLLTYFGKSVFPVNQSVHPTADTLSVVVGLIAIGVVAVLFLKPGIAARRTAFTGLLLFLILLVLPLWYSSGRSNPDFYEHRAYTSTGGLMLFLSAVRFRFQARSFPIVVSIILLLFFIKTSLRMNFYKNEENFLAEAIKEQPDYFLFQLQYAEVLAAKGDYATAIPYYDKALALRPDKADYFNARGKAHFYLGNFDAAIADISAAIKIAGVEPDFYINRCMVYNQVNAIDKAMRDLYVLMKCCRETVPAELKNEVGQKWRNKLKNLGERLTREPANDALYHERANMFFDTGQNDKGLADLKKALELAPQNVQYRKLYAEKIKN